MCVEMRDIQRHDGVQGQALFPRHGLDDVALVGRVEHECPGAPFREALSTSRLERASIVCSSDAMHCTHFSKVFRTEIAEAEVVISRAEHFLGGSSGNGQSALYRLENTFAYSAARHSTPLSVYKRVKVRGCLCAGLQLQSRYLGETDPRSLDIWGEVKAIITKT